MPTARQPLIFASWPTIEPTAPDAADTTTVSPGFRLADVEQADVRRHPRHAEHADRRRDRRRLRIELPQLLAVRRRVLLPAVVAGDDVAGAKPGLRDSTTSLTVCPHIDVADLDRARRTTARRSCGRACTDRARDRSCGAARRRRRALGIGGVDDLEVVGRRHAGGRDFSRIWRFMGESSLSTSVGHLTQSSFEMLGELSVHDSRISGSRPSLVPIGRVARCSDALGSAARRRAR